MPKHMERHVLGGMYVETSRLLNTVHDGFELAEKHERQDLADLSESVLSGVAIILRNRIGYLYEPLGDRAVLLTDEVNKLTKPLKKR